MRSGEVRTPRALARYPASARRSSIRPCGSPGPKASLGAAVSARRAAATQAARGNEPVCGCPCRRSYAGGGTAGVAAGAGGGADGVRSATRVPEPWRAVSHPSATSSAYASATVFRAIPRSAASERYGGSRVPGASRPPRTASRSARVSAARRPPCPDTSRCRSRPRPSAELTHESVTKLHSMPGRPAS